MLLYLPVIGFGQNEYYPNGKLRVEVETMKDYIFEVITWKKYYFENGNMSHQIMTDQNNNQLLFTIYDLNGKLVMEYRKHFDPDGNLLREGGYNINGEHGLWKYYYDPEDLETVFDVISLNECNYLQSEVTYINGEKGDGKGYYPNGELEWTCYDLLCTLFYKNGQIKYINGMCWDENGKNVSYIENLPTGFQCN